MNFGNDWREDACSVKDKLKYTLTNENTQQDVVIVVGCGSTEIKIKAHSFMLFVGSQVLERLLEQAKMNNEGMKVIKLPDVLPEAMKFVLKYIYTDCTEWENEDGIDILYASLKLKLRGLAVLCVTKLKDEMSAANVLRINEESVKMNVEELVQKSQEFILKNAQDVFQKEQFKSITNESLCKLLAFDELEMDEISIFNFVMGWSRAECARVKLEKISENLRFVLKNIVPLIRFTLMSLQEFTTVVVPTKILDDKEVNYVLEYLTMKTSRAGKQAGSPLSMSSTSKKKVINGVKKASTTYSCASGTSQPANRVNLQEEMQLKNTNKYIRLQYLKSISGRKTISGLHVTFAETDHISRKVQTIQRITGMNPGILTLRMPRYSAGVTDWQSFTKEIISNWNNGYLVHIVWWNSDHPLELLEIFKTRYGNMWNHLINENGHLNREWKNQLDFIVPYFQRLQKKGVVVICDILPWINNKEYFWGRRLGMNGSKKLYQITHDYMTQKHQLHSLLWNCSFDINWDMTNLKEFWPGNEYVDVVSVYCSYTKQLEMKLYQKLLEVVGNKPISMEYVYTVPSSELLAVQPRWAWFTAYDISLENITCNNNDNIKATFQSLSIINKENNDLFKPS